MGIFDSYNFLCPYCGTTNSLEHDFGAGSRHRLIQDCEICCRPIHIELRMDQDQVQEIRALKEYD